jgi:ABC-type nitrate/sulfonate/bicarbonate transport system permease component
MTAMRPFAIARLRRPLIGLAAFALAWQALVMTGRIPQAYLPGVPAILQAIVGQLGTSDFWIGEAMTLTRAVSGLLIATGTGVGAALLGARCPVVERAFSPIVQLMVSLPPAALVPLSIFAFGLGQALFMFIVGFACVWTVYISSVNALRANEPVQTHVARTFGYGRWEILLKVRLPAAVPEISTGVRLAAGGSLMATIAAEMLAGQNGLGYMLYETAFSLRIPEMFALLVVAGVNGVLLNAAVVRGRRTLAGWHDQLAAMAAA